ncbi:MAG: hypothetical protein ACX94B_13770 [Henriciella sp.]
MIGTISGADIDVLRLQESLKPLGEGAPPLLVWSGAIEARTETAARGPALIGFDPNMEANYLRSMLLRAPSATYRDQLRRACQAYLKDIELAAQSGQHVTMNWDAFGGGDRARNRSGSDPVDASWRVRSAAEQISALEQTLGAEDASFLKQMVVHGLSRAKLARHFAIRPALVEGRARRVLRGLIDVYERTG